jgi:hypothetical protein
VVFWPLHAVCQNTLTIALGDGQAGRVRLSVQDLPKNEIKLNLSVKIKYLLPLVALVVAGCVTKSNTVATPPSGPTLAEIQSMVQAHVSDSVIVSQIQVSSTRYYLTADQIIALKAAGVSDNVINALINTARKPVQTTTTVYQGPYIYPYWYVYPWPYGWWGGRPYYYGGYYNRGYYHGGGYHHYH